MKAWLESDRKTVDSILASDWSVINLTGHVLRKEQVMKEFGSGERRIESGSVDDLKVRAFGNPAVVTGRSELSGTYQGTRAGVTQRFTHVFVKRNGRWQAVASQGTQVAEDQGVDDAPASFLCSVYKFYYAQIAIFRRD